MPAQCPDQVLVVDDEPLIRLTIEMMVRDSDYQTRSAADGIAALAAIEEALPNILICDLNMPRMSGYELLSIVRRRFPEIFVIATSASYSGATVPMGVAADAFYAKGGLKGTSLIKILEQRVGNGFLSERQPAPIWMAIERDDVLRNRAVPVSCPCCLRGVDLEIREQPTETRCPHCAQRVHMEAVPQLWLNGAPHVLVSMTSSFLKRRHMSR
ncbi:response regulator [Granulicella paludicola]|uniref:response regulator n=1 Tax=Granulicella paludicola TaxID=474951 RepID=UPI0037BF9AAE